MSFDLRLLDGDLVLNKDGSLDIVTDTEKLIQDGIKMLITPVGGNKLHQWYGCMINKFLIGNVFDTDFSFEVAKQQIRNALENLMMWQRQQSKIQNLSPAETIVQIQNIYVNTNNKDKRYVDVKVYIISGELKPIELKYAIRV